LQDLKELFLLIQLTKYSLPASYEYLAIPKVEMSCFLMARVAGWNSLNLIDGTANVYFGNTYIGESQLQTRFMGDTLELSLGRDSKVLVSRQKVIDRSLKSFLGSKKKESFVYEIQIKNNQKVPVTVKLQDQVPISQLSEIDVEILDISGADLNETNGKLQWMPTILPGESKRYKVSFEVKYPKNMDITISKNRVVRTPRFSH
jgi:uncharacterized protein (TIGR02231 family)